MKHKSFGKQHEVVRGAISWMNLESITLSKKSVTKDNKLHDSVYVNIHSRDSTIEE